MPVAELNLRNLPNILIPPAEVVDPLITGLKGLPNILKDPAQPSVGPMGQDPYTFLTGLPRGTGVSESSVRGLAPDFAHRFARFADAVSKQGGTVQFTSARQDYSQTHGTGNAADFWVNDGKGNDLSYATGWPKGQAQSESAKKWVALANENGLGVLDEYVQPSKRATAPHFHASPTDIVRDQTTPLQPGRPKRAVRQLEDMMEAQAAKYGIPADVFKNLLNAESGYRRDAGNSRVDLRTLRSSAGAMGISQIMPDTLPGILRKIGRTEKEFHASENVQIEAGASYLADQMKRFGNVAAAVTAYNAGPGGTEHFQRVGKVDYRETRMYAAQILGLDPATDQVDKALTDPKYKFTETTRATAQAQEPRFSILRQMQKETYGQIPTLWKENKAGLPFAVLEGGLVAPPLAAEMALDWATGTKRAEPVEDAEWSKGYYASRANGFFLSIPEFFGVHGTEEYRKYRTSRGFLSADTVGDMAVNLPMLFFMAEVALPKLGMKVVGAGAGALATGALGGGGAATTAGATAGAAAGAGIEWVAQKLMASAAAGTLPKAGATFVKAAAALGGMPALRTAGRWAAAAGFEGFNKEMGNQFAEGKTVQEAIPVAMKAAQWDAAIMATFSFAIPYVLGGGMAMAMGARDAITQHASKQGLGTHWWSDLPSAVRVPMEVAARSTFAGLEASQKQFFMDIGLNARSQMMEYSRISERLTGLKAAERMSDSSAQALRQKSMMIAQELEGVRRQHAVASQQVAYWKNLRDTHFRADPDVPRFANMFDRQQKLLARAAQLPPNTPLPQQKFLMDQIKDLEDAMNPLRQNKAVQEYLNSSQKVAEAETVLRPIANSDMWMHQQAIERQIQDLDLKATINANLAVEARKAASSPRPGDFGLSRTLEPILRDGVPMTKTQREELPHYAIAMMDRAEQAEATLMESGPGIMTREAVRSDLDALSHPKVVVDTLRDHTNNLRNWLVQHDVKLPTPGPPGTPRTPLKPPRSRLEREVLRRFNALDQATKEFEEFPAKFTTRRMESMMNFSSDTMKMMQREGIPLEPFAGPGGVPELYADPLSLANLRDARTLAASTWMTEQGAPSLANLRQTMESISASGAKPDVAGVVDQGRAFRNALTDNADAVEAMDYYTQNFVNGLLLHPDDVRGIAEDVFGLHHGATNAAATIADDTMGRLSQSLRRMHQIPEGKSLAQHDPAMAKLYAAAIEGDEVAVNQLIRYIDPAKGIKYGDAAQPLMHFYNFQAMLEHYSLWDPNLKNVFIQNHLMHIHTRIRKYMPGADGEDRAWMTEQLGKEKQRTLASYEVAEQRYREAQDDLRAALARDPAHPLGQQPNPMVQTLPARAQAVGPPRSPLPLRDPLPMKDELDFLKLPSDRHRAAVLFKSTHPQDAATLVGAAKLNQTQEGMVKSARGVKWGLLMGEPELDPAIVMRQSVDGALRVGSLRRILVQLNRMRSPEGRHLLENVEGEGGKDIPQGFVRVGTSDKLEPKSYKRLSEIPGLSGAKIDGLGARDLAIHPGMVEYVERYLSYATRSRDNWADKFRDATELVRAGVLMGSPVPYFFTAFSNMALVNGSNARAAVGMTRVGKMMNESADALRYRGLKSGLEPTSLIQMVKQIPEGLMKDPVTAAETRRLMLPSDVGMRSPGWGQSGAKGALPESAVKALQEPSLKNFMEVLKNGITRPARGVANTLINSDSAMNSALLFQQISDAQFGAWALKSAELWQRLSPDLLQRHSYQSALFLVERLAAQQINRAAGTLSLHLLSDTAKNMFYTFGLAPRLNATRWDTVVGVLDGLITKFGVRSRYAAHFDPTILREHRDSTIKFLAGSMLSNWIGTQLISYAINNHSTYSNEDPLRTNKIQISKGPEGAKYIVDPIDRMFAPFVNAVTAGTKLEPLNVIKSLSGLLGPSVSMEAELFQGKDRFGQQYAPESLKDPGAMNAWADFFMNRTLPLDDVFGLAGSANLINAAKYGVLGPTRDYPKPGTPYSAADAALQAVGAYPSTSIHPETGARVWVAKQIAWPKWEMEKYLDLEVLKYVQAGGPNTAEGLEIREKAKYHAFNVGFPVATKQFQDQFRSIAPAGSPASETGNYILPMKKPALRGFFKRFENGMNPKKAAREQTPHSIRPILDEMLDEDE